MKVCRGARLRSCCGSLGSSNKVAELSMAFLSVDWAYWLSRGSLIMAAAIGLRLDVLKGSAPRIGNGKHQGAERCRLCGPERAGDGLERRLGGHHVIHNDDPLASDRFRPDKRESALQVLEPLCPG